MLYSYSPEEEKKRLFSIFILDAKNGNERYASEVKKVLREVIDLCTGNKTIYNIDRNYFEIIIGLADHYNSFYKNLNLSSLDAEVYDQVWNHIQELDKLEYA